MNSSLIFLIFASLLLRLVSLNQSLWLDEATTARVVQQYDYGQILTQFSPHDFHPPLYYLLMKLWTNIFGYSEIALRAPSVLASLLTGLFIYKIVIKSIKSIKSVRSVKSMAIWAAAFFLFNPLIVYYSQEARMYSFVTLLVTLTFWSVTKFQVKRSKLKVRYVVLANVFIALSLGSYYGSVFFIAALYGYLLLKKEFKVFLYLLPGTMIAGILLYPLFLTQLKNSGEVLKAIPNWSVTLGQANLKNLLLIPIKFASGRISWEPKIFYYAVAGAWTVFVSYFVMLNLPTVMLNLVQHLHGILKPHFALRATRGRRVRNDTVILYTLYLLPILLGFLVSFYKPLLQYFRFIYVIPFMSMLLCINTGKRWQRSVLLAGFVFFSLIYTYMPSFHREDWKSLVKALPSKTVYLLPSSIDPIKYYDLSIKSNNILAVMPKERSITMIPYAAEIYGFDYVEKLSSLKYRKTREIKVRGLYFEVWTR